MKKRITLAGLCVVVLSFAPANTEQRRSLPNVVFFLADDVGYGDIGVYGGVVPTPNIDRLAREGMRFTDAHAPAALCAPSRFSLLTGSNPYRNGRPGGSWNINVSSGFTTGTAHLREGRHLTAGEILQRAGYRTAFLGKGHLGGDVYDTNGKVIRAENEINTMDFARGIRDSLNEHGFDYSLLLASGIQHEPYAFFENGRYVPVDPASPPDNRSTVLRKSGRYEVTDNGVCEIVEAAKVPARCDVNYDSSQVGRILTAKGLQFIDDHLALNQREGRDRPFLLYFSSQAIHVPHTPPIDFDGDPKVLDRPVQGLTGGATSDVLYELDLQLGALVAKLRDEELLENTIIIFTSDNGALWPNVVQYGDPRHDNNGPFRDYKASVYEGGHRVPFIVRWPSRVEPGTVSDQLIVNHDWVATMYELTGQTMAEHQAMDSASLLPILTGKQKDPLHEFVIYQAGFAYDGAIREGAMVLLVDKDEKATELYDLATDIAQERNLIADPKYSDVVTGLRAKFLKYNDHDDKTFDEPRTTPPVVGTRPDAPSGMVWIPSGAFAMGSMARDVHVDGFFIDETEVTNAAFEKFVNATGYITVAERVPAGSVVFTPPAEAVPLDSPLRWWSFVPGANWRHPEGPASDLTGRMNHPVVHVAWEDAAAYARWAGKRLPTEAEWEKAARGGLAARRYVWGDVFRPDDRFMANTFQGTFPHRNAVEDGFAATAPVRSFPPNGYALHDMAGNVWEWVADSYGPDPREPGIAKRVQKGGSFLCSDRYCSRYEPGLRGSGAADTGTNHVGFRCVVDAARPR